jgi:hypothetical protein
MALTLLPWKSAKGHRWLSKSGVFQLLCVVLSQAVLSRTEQFGTAHEGIRCMLSELQQRLAVVDVLQPDVPSKEGQAQQLRVRAFSGGFC